MADVGTKPQSQATSGNQATVSVTVKEKSSGAGTTQSQNGETSINMSSLIGDFKLPVFQNYDYAAFIKQPDDMSMNSDVTGFGLDTIATNIGGLIEYIEILISGKTNASKAVSLFNPNVENQPIGNAYFYDSGATCICEGLVDQPAYMYMNNVPMGNIPFLSSLTGDVGELRGLIPGMVEDMDGFNPQIFLNAFSISPSSECIQVELPITQLDKEGKAYKEGVPKTKYDKKCMLKDYVKLIDPCLFKPDKDGNQSNPVATNNAICINGPAKKDMALASSSPSPTIPSNSTGTSQARTTNENFANISNDYKFDLFKEDNLIQLYFIFLFILFLFIVLKITFKKSKR